MHLLNLALEKVIRDAEVNAIGMILFKPTQLLGYADEQEAIDARY